tara:strand:- start:2627 stop:2806 length:180 start_codon:yes stop_codon:yes gene_type:complete
MEELYLENRTRGSISLTKVKEGFLVENRQTSVKKLHENYREAAWLFRIWSKNQDSRYAI